MKAPDETLEAYEQEPEVQDILRELETGRPPQDLKAPAGFHRRVMDRVDQLPVQAEEHHESVSVSWLTSFLTSLRAVMLHPAFSYGLVVLLCIPLVRLYYQAGFGPTTDPELGKILNAPSRGVGTPDESGQHRRAFEVQSQELPITQQDAADPIRALLALAQRQEAAKRLTTPAHDNAWESYQIILRLAPGHPEALAGIRRIRALYVGWGKREEQQENWYKAQAYYEKAQALDPGDESILAALALVRKKRRAVENATAPASSPPLPDSANRAPIIARRLPTEQQVVMQQGTSRAFLAEATDPENAAVTYSWEVDDQPVSASDMRFTFTPQDIGTRLVRLTVTDTEGLSTTAEWLVQVQPR